MEHEILVKDSKDNEERFKRLKALKDESNKKIAKKSTETHSVKEKLIGRTYATIEIDVGNNIKLIVRTRMSAKEANLLKDAFNAFGALETVTNEDEFNSTIQKIAELMYVLVVNDELDLDFWMDSSNWSMEIVSRIIMAVMSENEKLISQLDESFPGNRGVASPVRAVQDARKVTK